MEHPLIEEAKRRYPEGALLNWPEWDRRRSATKNGYLLDPHIKFDSTKIFVNDEGNLLQKRSDRISSYLYWNEPHRQWISIVEPSLHMKLKEHLASVTQAEFDQAWIDIQGKRENIPTVNEFMESLTKKSLDLRPYKMKRVEVYQAISSERDFQDIMIAKEDRPEIIHDLHVGDGIAAIEHNLQKAREAWYSGSTPHEEAMGYLRKVAGICVKLGEVYGMPSRKE